jgi:hypothetical protein
MTGWLLAAAIARRRLEPERKQIIERAATGERSGYRPTGIENVTTPTFSPTAKPKGGRLNKQTQILRLLPQRQSRVPHDPRYIPHRLPHTLAAAIGELATAEPLVLSLVIVSVVPLGRVSANRFGWDARETFASAARPRCH